MEQLFTQKDLAERWKLDVTTIKNYRESGIITPVKGIPAIRFTEQHILELEGVKLEKVSPLMYRRLELEKNKIEEENKKLKGILTNVLTDLSPILKEA